MWLFESCLKSLIFAISSIRSTRKPSYTLSPLSCRSMLVASVLFATITYGSSWNKITNLFSCLNERSSWVNGLYVPLCVVKPDGPLRQFYVSASVAFLCSLYNMVWGSGKPANCGSTGSHVCMRWFWIASSGACLGNDDIMRYNQFHILTKTLADYLWCLILCTSPSLLVFQTRSARNEF